MDSLKYIKNLIKTKSIEKNKALKAGNFIIFRYNAKDKTKIYDKTPLCFVLWTSNSYMLAINLHWCPIPMREILMKFIFKINSNNIKNNLPLECNYQTIKPVLFRLGFYPVIRLYIKKGISNQVVKIPNSDILTTLRTKTETFTGGKYSAEQLYKKALKNSRKDKK